MAIISLEFSINGKQYLVPKEWEDLRERFEFGQISNQPLIESERFTFVGDAAAFIYDHYRQGRSLRGIDVSLIATNDDLTVDLFKDYIIDLTEGVDFAEPDFAQVFSPKEVVVSIKKKEGLGQLSTELQGLTWGLLLKEGYVKPSDYTECKTAVKKVYNNVEIGLALLSIYLIASQLQQLIEQTKEFVKDSVARLSGADPSAKVGAVIYIAAVLVLRAAAALVLLATLVSTVINLITLLVPPIVRNKSITLRRGLEIIFGYFGYEFVSDIKELDKAVILPSKPRNFDGNYLTNLLPSFAANKDGIPKAGDYGYICLDFVEGCRKLCNGRIDVVDGKVLLRWENDPSLFIESGFSPAIDVSRDLVQPNLTEIPNTTIYSFADDLNDEYTLINYKGTSYEVFNKSVDRPFKGEKRVDFGWALGTNKTELTNIELVMLSFATIADTLAAFLGQRPNLVSRIRKDRVNVLIVSDNNFSTAKIVPLINGNMPRNHRDIISAKAIENKYYYNRSIVRGTGQKLIVPSLEMPFNLRDREEILKRGSFIDSKGSRVNIRSLDFQYSKDKATAEIEIENNYIAPSDVKEILYEPE